AVLFAGGVVVTFLELQLERPKSVRRNTTTSVVTTRPGVQKDFLDLSEARMDHFSKLLPRSYNPESGNPRQVIANNRIFPRHQRNARPDLHEYLLACRRNDPHVRLDDFIRIDCETC